MKNKIDFIEKLPKFSGDENYWIISSGKQRDLYDYFNKKEIVGLAWDKLSIEDVKGKSLDEIKNVFKIKYASLKDSYKDDGGYNRATTIISKEINFFVNKMKIGDIVVVKDRSKKQLMFGKVKSESIFSDEHYNNLPIDKLRGNCNKIRGIEWLKIRDKEYVSDKIKNNIRVNQAIFKVNDELVINDINKTIFSLFLRKDYMHAVFNLRQEDDIEFENYYKFLELVHKFKKHRTSSDKLYIKSNVSSPGPVEIFGTLIEVKELLMALGMFTFATTGVLSAKYLKVKKDLDIIGPGEDEGFDMGN